MNKTSVTYDISFVLENSKCAWHIFVVNSIPCLRCWEVHEDGWQLSGLQYIHCKKLTCLSVLQKENTGRAISLLIYGSSYRHFSSSGFYPRRGRISEIEWKKRPAPPYHNIKAERQILRVILMFSLSTIQLTRRFQSPREYLCSHLLRLASESGIWMPFPEDASRDWVRSSLCPPITAGYFQHGMDGNACK